MWGHTYIQFCRSLDSKHQPVSSDWMRCIFAIAQCTPPLVCLYSKFDLRTRVTSHLTVSIEGNNTCQWRFSRKSWRLGVVVKFRFVVITLQSLSLELKIFLLIGKEINLSFSMDFIWPPIFRINDIENYLLNTKEAEHIKNFENQTENVAQSLVNCLPARSKEF